MLDGSRASQNRKLSCNATRRPKENVQARGVTAARQAVDALAGQPLRIPLDAIFETVFVANAIHLITNAQQFAFNITFVTAGS
jgi:hypothetical protein